jgi:asparagine synthetase B (glutamine-hydrolysing)
MGDLAPKTGLTAFEMASGFVGGGMPGAEPLPQPARGLSALEALEEATLPALRRGPCFVSFSGGRDSSIVLAAAARAARRDRLTPPVPVTLRFPNAPDTEEAAWQERVVDHLALERWQRLELDEELDYVGPIAQRSLLRHGLLYPFNAHFHAPIVEAAAGGTVLTGYGGDDLLLAWRWAREAQIISGRARPRRRDLPRFAYFASPLAVRRLAVGRLAVQPRAWLTSEGNRLYRRAVARDADEPRRFDARVGWLARRRYLALGQRSVSALGEDTNTRVESPLLDPGFLAVVAREGGRFGPGDRTSAMRRFFADALPADVLSRETKATFADVFYRSHTREFLRDWDGQTPFPELVLPDKMRSAWDDGDAYTPRLLLQASWLAAARRRSPAGEKVA